MTLKARFARKVSRMGWVEKWLGGGGKRKNRGSLKESNSLACRDVVGVVTSREE